MSHRNTKQATGATYQSVIIALVAAGILSTGLVSILYRRRQRHNLLRAAQSGMRMVILPDGRVYTVPRDQGTGLGEDGRGGKAVGRQPRIWDALLGEEEDEEGDGKKRSYERGVPGEDRDVWRVSDFIPGVVRCADGCLVEQPMSLAFPPSVSPLLAQPGGPPDSGDKAVEMTILIAMPTSSSSSLHKPDHSFIPQFDPELNDLPLVEIATTNFPVSSSLDDRRILRDYRAEAMEWNGTSSDRVPTPPRNGARIERVDGFRGS